MKLFNKERNQMTLKRLVMPIMVLGIVLMMCNMGYAVTSISCGLSFPTGPGFGSTARATATGHTEPVAAGTPTNAILSPLTPGGGTIRVTCINTGTAGSATD